ncbi:MAG: alpha-glucosidase C-terminal domain-containing protein [Chloroflexota bacterium]
MQGGPDVYAWRRDHDGETILCAVNFAAHDASLDVPSAGQGRAWQLRFGSADPVRTDLVPAGQMVLRPLEAIVIEAADT